MEGKREQEEQKKQEEPEFWVNIEGRRCYLFKKGGVPKKVLFWMADIKNQNVAWTAEQIAKRTENEEWLLAVCGIEDWNGELSPWKAPAVFGTEDFKGGADTTIHWLENFCIPHVCSYFDLEKKGERPELFIGGYSLAGLFSLYAYYETGLFTGAGSCSGSLWYPGWEEYVKGRRPVKNSSIYISLGKKEEKTKNPVMKIIGDRTRELYRWYQSCQEVENVVLEWNEGNHFTEPEVRVAKGFAWLISAGL